MDYALLAATALGAIGLYLLLPRERAPVARLGGLLGAMALAGFFLFLVRTVHGSGATGDGQLPPVYFYLFAAIMIAGAVGVVCQPRPVYAALYFVLVTLAGAGMFVLLMADFMAIVLIIIYAGAILVTYVFVIMLASQGSTGGSVIAPAYDRQATGSFTAVLISFLLIGAVLQVLLPTDGRIIATQAPTIQRDDRMAAGMGLDIAGNDLPATTAPAPSDAQILGVSLYSKYPLSLELAGILLTIALIGAVVISRKNSTPEQILGSGTLPSE